MSAVRVRVDRVDNAALRREFHRQQAGQGLTAADVARALGWWRRRDRPDSQRVERALGITARAERRRQTTMTYDLAVAFTSILDMDPVDAGV